VSTGLLLAGLVPVVAALVTGVLLLRARLSRAAGWLLLAAGAVGGLAIVLWGRGAASAAACGVAAVAVLLPAALWAYPRPRWQHPVDVVLAVLVVAPGVVAVLRPTEEVVFLMGMIATAALVGQGWWRLETEQGRWRAPLVWSSLSSAVVVVLAWTVPFLTEDSDWTVAAVLMALAAVPISMGVGVLRPQVVDPRALVVQAVVVLVLLVGYVAAFVGGQAALDLLGASDATPVVLALLGFGLALGLPPAARLLRGAMDRMLFGERPDPLEAASSVVARLGDNPRDALDTVRDALALPYLAIVGDDGVALQSGTPAVHHREAVLDSAGRPRTRLVVGLRPGDLRVSDADARVLGLVLPLVVQLMRADQLTDRLQESRRATVETIADERRRLRRELHDGLGPTLTGIAFATDAARNTLRADPHGAAELLAVVRADTADAITQIRGLVYGMRPPALDEVGLVQALRQQALTLRRADGATLSVAFHVDGTPPKLPAAVEVAAYRIVLEALTNVARHTTSGSADVRVGAADGTLTLEVTDAGGLHGPWTPGVGVASMRERAAELGGTLTCGPGQLGGIVRATLPYRP
jgi:signal transduction histidine kinase